jgi:CxxC motif-containing protein
MAQEHRKFICITCPRGCALDVTMEGETVVKMEGNSCKRGIDYVTGELNDPRRMVTTTVRVRGGVHPLAPVYTESPIPKPRIFDLLAEIRKIELRAPVKFGDVVIENALGTGVNILASRNIPAKSEAS